MAMPSSPVRQNLSLPQMFVLSDGKGQCVQFLTPPLARRVKALSRGVEDPR